MRAMKSLVASIAFVSSVAFAGNASAGSYLGFQPLTGEALGADSRSSESASASTVGRCNALAGRALGLVHRIDQGQDGLCQNLLNLFVSFGAAGCLERLANGELFLNHAIGEYRLACQVFTETCNFPPPDPPVCVFAE
jgi:hypothetical protein